MLMHIKLIVPQSSFLFCPPSLAISSSQFFAIVPVASGARLFRYWRGERGGERTAPCSQSPLFLPSCVLTCPLSPSHLEPHTESARAVRPRPGRISRLSRGPRPGAGGGTTSPHHSQSKCHLPLTCKSVTIAPLGVAISGSGGERNINGICY